MQLSDKYERVFHCNPGTLLVSNHLFLIIWDVFAPGCLSIMHSIPFLQSSEELQLSVPHIKQIIGILRDFIHSPEHRVMASTISKLKMDLDFDSTSINQIHLVLFGFQDAVSPTFITEPRNRWKRKFPVWETTPHYFPSYTQRLIPCAFPTLPYFPCLHLCLFLMLSSAQPFSSPGSLWACVPDKDFLEVPWRPWLWMRGKECCAAMFSHWC